MAAFGFCLEFVVPHDVDIGHPDRFTNDPEPNPVMDQVRTTIAVDVRWTMLRVNGANPSMFVCVAVDAADVGEARAFVLAAVGDVVSDLIPGVRFVNIEPTIPDPP